MTTISSISGVDALRILCGVFFIPHLIWDLRNPQEGSEIYDVAGIGFARTLFVLSVCTETALLVCFIIGVFPRLTACIAVFYLVTAAAVMWKVERRWLWNFKGVEFLIFWACCCVLIAVWGA